MGLLDKVKNLFTEEIEEEPIRKEVKRVEITKPKIESVKVETVRPNEEIKVSEEKKEEPQSISESSALNKDEKFRFPVYFDDKDFEDLPKTREKKAIKPEARPQAYQGTSPIKNEPKKKFKVSPVISPVYGVLDKNYNKEDIRIKSDKSVKKFHYEEKLTVDDIRKKAYGTLEDDLENSLFAAAIENEKPAPVDTGIDIFEEIENIDTSTNKDLLMHDITFEKEKVTVETKETLEEPTVALEAELEKQKQKIDELSKYINTIQSEAEILEPVKEPEQNIIEEAVKKEENEEMATVPETSKAEEGDLFSLIDSMYEKREES